MRRITIIMIALLAVVGCHRKNHHGDAEYGNGNGSGSPPPVATPDTTRPTVSSTVPADGATGVVVGITLTATFSEPMNGATVSATSFTLSDAAMLPVTGTVSYDVASRTASFLPLAPLLNNTLYTARITTAVTDVAGNAMAADYVWTFTTELDTTPPTVTSTIPADLATGVLTYSAITATFSEAMLASTIDSPATSFTVMDAALVSVAGTVSYDAVTFIATFQPSADLAISTVYTATITVAVTDLAGNAMLVSKVWSFTTSADGVRPTIECTVPDNDAVIWPLSYPPPSNVATNRRIAACFSEAMLGSTINDMSFLLASGPLLIPVSGTVSYDAVNQVAYFLPDAPLVPFTVYTATIVSTVTDLAGNEMLVDYVWTFTTGASADAIAPTVECTIPDAGETGVATNRKIVAYFSEPMDSLTIDGTSFLVTDALLVPVAGTVTYDVTNHVASFRPTVPFAVLTTFTATITTSVEDLAGVPMALSYVWSFTTGALTDVVLPSVTATIPITAATGVPINTRVTALFDEPMDSESFTTSTFTFTLQAGATSVPGTVVLPCRGTSATFIPAGDLLPATLYTATVTTGVKDLAGNSILVNYVWTFTTGAAARTGQLPVVLAEADPFAILAGSTITNTGPTVVNGDVGLDPSSAIVGLSEAPLATPGTVNGTIYGPGPIAAAAKLALSDAYIDAAGRSVDSISCPSDLGGLTLAPGLYTTAISAQIVGIGPLGILTLDAQGDENAVWIFQIGTTLKSDPATSIVLSGGAQAKNVFWQVGSSATFDTTSVWKGTVMAEASVSLLTGAVLDGRALCNSAAVTLDSNTVTRP